MQHPLDVVSELCT